MDLQEYYRKLAEQLPEGSLPENFASNVPPEVQNEFTSRIPATPEPVQSGVHAPSSFDVDVSNTTLPMRGRADSLPSSASMDDAPASPIYEVEEDAPSPTSTPMPIAATPDAPKAKSDRAMEAVLSTDNDSAAREAGLADLEKRRKRGIIPQVLAGAGDAISASASAFGGNAPGGSMQRLVERQDKDMDQGKKDIETRLRNDAGSDISKQYQELLGQFMQKDPTDPTILGLTANQISEKIPQIEKLATLRQQEELKRLELQNEAAKGRTAQQTKELENTEKQQLAATEAKQQADVIRRTIKDIANKKLIGWDTTGPAGMKMFAPIDKPNLEAKLDTIKANIAFDKLNKLRQASPTGGAVGQVSDKDMVLLQSVLGSLSTDQSPEELRSSLKHIDDIFTKFQGYGASSPDQQTTSSQRQTKSGLTYTPGK